MRDQRGLHRRHGETEGHCRQAKRHDEGKELPAQQHSASRADGGERYGRPPDRFALRREVKDDAGAVGDRKPRQKAAGGEFLRGPSAHLCLDDEFETRPRNARRGACAAGRPKIRPEIRPRRGAASPAVLRSVALCQCAFPSALKFAAMLAAEKWCGEGVSLAFPLSLVGRGWGGGREVRHARRRHEPPPDPPPYPPPQGGRERD